MNSHCSLQRWSLIAATHCEGGPTSALWSDSKWCFCFLTFGWTHVHVLRVLILSMNLQYCILLFVQIFFHLLTKCGWVTYHRSWCFYAFEWIPTKCFSHVHLRPFFASIQHPFSPCSQVSCEHVCINKEPNISQEMQHIGLYRAETNVPLYPKLSHREKRNCNITRVHFVWLKIF